MPLAFTQEDFLVCYPLVISLKSQTTVNTQGILTVEPITLGLAYNEFGYYEHPSTTSRFVCVKIIDSNVKKVGY